MHCKISSRFLKTLLDTELSSPKATFKYRPVLFRQSNLKVKAVWEMTEQALTSLGSAVVEMTKLMLPTAFWDKTVGNSSTSIFLSVTCLPRSSLTIPLVKLIGRLKVPSQDSWLHLGAAAAPGRFNVTNRVLSLLLAYYYLKECLCTLLG